MQRSAKAFLDDVDPGSVAGGFRARQAAEIGALGQVPLLSWSYIVSSPVTDAAATAAAAKRLGGPTLIVHVSLAYALQRVDPMPATHDLWWTFVTRHGHVYLAGDADMAQLGGASWHGVWDFGPIVARRGTSGLVLAHPQDTARLPALVAAVDAAVPAVTRVWGTGWARQVAVIVPASAEELAAVGGQDAALSDIAAATVFEAPNPGTGSSSGARILMNPAGLATLTPVGRRIVVQHEVTHVASAASTGPASPRWLVEGFADYVGNLDSGQSVTAAASELRREVAAGTLPGRLPADGAFQSVATGLPQIYEQSWLACRLIAARAGQHGLVRLYRLVGASEGSEATAVDAALHSVLHESTTEFTARWRAYLTAQLA
ncbi:MAG: hypothetical protein JWO57_4439 [Pseudonocardiales bacterium]|nr:hypothetical protein [Pseudonocardiales bacterium]